MLKNSLKTFAEIKKFDEEQRMVWGYASTEALDCQGEIVSKEAMIKAWDDYMAFGNIREMHGSNAAGIVKEFSFDENGVFIGVKVVDDAAWKKVKELVYKGFSIGGNIVRKVGNIIEELILVEISLVDRPANPKALITVFKNASLEKEEVEIVEKENEVEKNDILKSLEETGLSSEELIDFIKKAKEAKELEKSQKREELLSKGFYEVQEVVCVLANLSYVLENIEWEAKWSDETDTSLLVSLKEQISSISALVKEMLDKEVTNVTDESVVIELSQKSESIVKFLEANPVKEIEIKEEENKEIFEVSKSKEFIDLKKSYDEKDLKIKTLTEEVELLKSIGIFEKKVDEVKTVVVEKESTKKSNTISINEQIEDLDKEIESLRKSSDKSDLNKASVLVMKRNQLQMISGF